MTEEEQREKERAIVQEAWRQMLNNPSFHTVFADIQRYFPPGMCAFQSEDGFNPHAAAVREGSRKVITYIHAKMNPALYSQDDVKPKPTHAQL